VYKSLTSSARRTKSATPLGLLFDHGIDAINSIFGSANWICAMGLSPIIANQRWQIYITIFAPMICFFLATWEQYYTGELILPVFNGPTEGLLLGASLSMITSWYGREFWHGTQMYDTLVSPWLPSVLGGYFSDGAVLNYNMVLCATVLAAIKECVERITLVVRKHGILTLEKTVPSILLLTASIPIIHSDNFSRNPRTCLHLFALLFFDMVGSLMLDHCCEMNYNPYRRIIVPFVIFGVCTYVDVGMGDEIRIDQFLLAYTAVAFTYACVETRLIIHEICDVLGVWCFDIVTPHPGRKQE